MRPYILRSGGLPPSGAGGGFSPASLGGALGEWFNADDHGTASMTDDGGGAISAWVGRVLGLSVTAATTARPTFGAGILNGRPALNFDGVANCLRGVTVTGLPVGTDAGEIWVLGSVADAPANRHAVSYGGTSANTLRRITLGATGKLRNSDGTAICDSVAAWQGPVVFGGQFTATTIDGRANGVPSPQGTGAVINTGTTRLAIGSSNATAAANFWLGHIRQVIFTVGLLSLVQRLQLEAWLAWDGGAQGRLPFDHPYRSVRP